MIKIYKLFRKNRDKDEVWKPTAKGSIDYILTVLDRNIRIDALTEFDWKIKRRSELND